MDKNTDLNAYYHEGAVTKRQMNGLAYFHEKFADPDFELGHFPAMTLPRTGPKKPEFILSDIGYDFVAYCINERLTDFRLLDDAEWNWGKMAVGGNMVANATPFELISMITYILGNPTHWQSRLINAYQSGLLMQILARGAEWADPEKLDSPILDELAA